MVIRSLDLQAKKIVQEKAGTQRGWEQIKEDGSKAAKTVNKQQHIMKKQFINILSL